MTWGIETLTRDEQRVRKSASMAASFNLGVHLLNLKRDILAGDTSKLSEFQQMLQYAPTEMRVSLDQLA